MVWPRVDVASVDAARRDAKVLMMPRMRFDSASSSVLPRQPFAGFLYLLNE